MGDVYAKGLKVYLTVDSNQRPQEGTIYTYQHGIQVDSRYHFIDQGITQVTLQYDDDVIDVGVQDLCVCVQWSTGMQSRIQFRRKEARNC